MRRSVLPCPKDASAVSNTNCNCRWLVPVSHSCRSTIRQRLPASADAVFMVRYVCLLDFGSACQIFLGNPQEPTDLGLDLSVQVVTRALMDTLVKPDRVLHGLFCEFRSLGSELV
jgi:hypothetical protein